MYVCVVLIKVRQLILEFEAQVILTKPDVDFGIGRIGTRNKSASFGSLVTLHHLEVSSLKTMIRDILYRLTFHVPSPQLLLQIALLPFLAKRERGTR